MTNCPLCLSSNSVRKWFSFSNPRKVGSPSLSYLRCHRCSLVFLYPFLNSSQLNKLYSDPKYFKKLCKVQENKLLSSLLQIRFFPEYDEYVCQQFSSPVDLLDIGCGNGEFLLSMKKRNWNVWGIDKSRVAIKNSADLLNNHKSRLLVADPSSQPFRKKFSAITMWHVVEHLSDPVRHLLSVRKIAAKDAKFIFEVPNADSLVMSVFKKHYSWLMVPEHIFYYSPKSIKILLELSGFKIEKLDFPPRAMLNFSLSLSKLIKPIFGRFISNLVLVLTIPISILVAFISSYTKKSEVMRVVATL